MVSLHMQLEILTLIMMLSKMYMFQESIWGLVSVEQDGDDYIRPNADLEIRTQIWSEEQLKYMYSEYWDGIGEFKDFEYHIELDPNKPRVQSQHNVVLSVELRLKKRVRSNWKARHSW